MPLGGYRGAGGTGRYRIVEDRWVLSLDLKIERESQFNAAGGSEFQVRGAAVLNDRLAMMSVEMARTAVGRTTIECCVRWCATRRAGSDTEEMTSAESWTSARPTCSWCAVQQAANAASETESWTSDRRGACRTIRAALFWTRWSFCMVLDGAPCSTELQ